MEYCADAKDTFLYSSLALEHVLDVANAEEDGTSPAKLAPILPATPTLETAATSLHTPPPDPSSPTRSHSLASSTHSSSGGGGGDTFLRGSSLEESPLSSPDIASGSSSGAVVGNPSATSGAADGEGERGTNGGVGLEQPRKDSESWELSDEEGAEEDADPGTIERSAAVPKNVKLPQRKGGMQLWQFLYALLTDPNRQFSDLMEWTSNVKAREFRLLEPESIAIWWGEHKNKKNMSYDKLSRSLRYYYDKGIIRKIPGERYVYQFCIDPELMYKHIGNSDCRPKLKPMPQSAIQATSKFQMQHGYGGVSVPQKDPIFIAQGPVMLNRGSGSFPGGDVSFMSPHGHHFAPPFAYDHSVSPYCQPAPQLIELSGQASFNHAPFDGLGRQQNLAAVRRCRSFESPLDNQFYIPEQDMTFNNHFLSMGSNMPVGPPSAPPLALNHSHPPLPTPQHSPMVSPPPLPGSGDLSSPIGSSISGNSPIPAESALDLDDIIEFTSSDAFSTSNSMVYTSCGVSSDAGFYPSPPHAVEPPTTSSLWTFH